MRLEEAAADRELLTRECLIALDMATRAGLALRVALSCPALSHTTHLEGFTPAKEVNRRSGGVGHNRGAERWEAEGGRILGRATIIDETP